MDNATNLQNGAGLELNERLTEAITDLVYRIADDELIVAHRNSEWTGLGPLLEEDIAFSSIAQDKMGHALALYTILHDNFGADDPDTIAFGRDESAFRCSHLMELPISDYAFSLTRHLLADLAEQHRFEMLESSTFAPLAKVARKLKGEIKYHVFHAVTWVTQLGAQGNEESKARMQTALNEAFPLALGMFEPGDYEKELQAAGVFGGEEELKERWMNALTPILEKAGLTIPSAESTDAAFGGRKGYHTEHLGPLLDEMTEVFRIDPSAEW